MTALTGTFASTSAFSGIPTLVAVQVINKPALLAILFPLTRLSQPGSLVWTLDPQPYISPVDQAALKLSVRSIKPRGVDDLRPDVTAGDRDVLLTLRAEAYGYEVEASELLNNVLTGIQRPSVGIALGAINLSYMKCGGVAALSYETDDRVVNVATCDIWLNATINDLFVDPSGTIATVNSGGVIPGAITP